MKNLTSSIVAAISAPILFEACAAGIKSYHTDISESSLIVPNEELMALQEPNSVLAIRARGLKGPVYLRKVDGKEMIALLSICTHRGCEVRPLPDSFECPCHGSEYDIDGEVLEGPARLPLKKFPVEKTSEGLVIHIT